MRTLALILAWFSFSSTAQAWGPVGHEVVAYIAADLLNPTAKATVGQILHPNPDLASIASWADNIRGGPTVDWHFINLPERSQISKGQEVEFCPNHHCVIDQITRQLDNLRSGNTPQKRRNALRFVVHLVGDVHQPLHCINDNDQGGNTKLVRLFSKSARGRKMSLHRLWDDLIFVSPGETSRSIATLLKPTEQTIAEFSTGSPTDWARESYQTAQTLIYASLPAGPATTPLALPKSYYDGTMRGIVNSQLQRAGIRLAMVLNRLWPGDQTNTPTAPAEPSKE